MEQEDSAGRSGLSSTWQKVRELYVQSAIVQPSCAVSAVEEQPPLPGAGDPTNQTTVAESPLQIHDMKCETVTSSTPQKTQYISLFCQILHSPAHPTTRSVVQCVMCEGVRV